MNSTLMDCWIQNLWNPKGSGKEAQQGSISILVQPCVAAETGQHLPVDGFFWDNDKGELVKNTISIFFFISL